MHSSDPTPLRGSLQMAAAMAISGTVGAFVLESGQQPFNVVFCRCLFGALSLGLYCAATGRLQRRHFTPRMLALSALCGVFIVFNWVLLFGAFRHASISIATAVYNTQPFMLIGLGALFLGEKVGAARLAWIAMAFAGLLLLLGLDPRALALDGAARLGFGMALGAALLYAFAALIIKRLAGVPAELTALVQVGLGALLLAPFVDFSALPAAPGPWAWLVGMGVLHTGLMYILLYSAIQSLPTARVAVLTFIYPAIALAVDHLFYGQHLGLAQWLGIALIALGNLGIGLGLGLGGRDRPAPAAR